jgi:hypothetical protein
MTLTPLDIALPIGLGALFGIFRFTAYRRAALEDAVTRASLDALKGMVGLAAITVALKYFTNT